MYFEKHLFHTPNKRGEMLTASQLLALEEGHTEGQPGELTWGRRQHSTRDLPPSPRSLLMEAAHSPGGSQAIRTCGSNICCPLGFLPRESYPASLFII